MNLHAALKYLEYSVFSSHRMGHGVHSPFVFNLITGVFRNKSVSDIVLRIEMIRKSMTDDRRLIEVTDMGAGSSVMKGKYRKVSEIASYSSVTRKYGLLLSKMAKEFGRSNIVELGTSLGISAMYLASGSPDTVVHSFEGCSATSSLAKENFKIAGFGNIRQYNMSFNDGLQMMESENITAGLVFIDGDHRRDSTIRYFNKAVNLADEKSVIIVDDIHLTREMSLAWDEIKSDSRITCSIDLNRLGLLFFRKGLTRTAYVIRY